jgi:hypothetical protein
MNGLPLEQQFFLAVQAAALLGLCLRFWLTGLYRSYWCFFVYLILALVQDVVLPMVPVRSSLYLHGWLASEALVVSFYALVVLETDAILLRSLPGIASAARRYITIALVLALLISLSLMSLEKAPATFVQYFLVCERAIVSSLLIFVLASVVFLAYYPVPLSRNAVLYSIGFAIYLTAKTATLFVGNLRYFWLYRPINSSLMAVSSACIVLWLFTLSRAGERKAMVVGHRWRPEDERRILTTLQAFNDSLIRMAKK